eukprot:12049464-Karenia_brevis.AAC.1
MTAAMPPCLAEEQRSFNDAKLDGASSASGSRTGDREWRLDAVGQDQQAPSGREAHAGEAGYPRQ